MTELPACIACGIDPQTTSLLVPLAQAAVISAPILLRRRVLDAVARFRRRGRSSEDPCAASLEELEVSDAAAGDDRRP